MSNTNRSNQFGWVLALLLYDFGEMMGAAFWIRRYFAVFVVASVLIGGAQLLKGHTLSVSSFHGILWGAISSSIFIATRMFYARRGYACAMCQDTPVIAAKKQPVN